MAVLVVGAPDLERCASVRDDRPLSRVEPHQYEIRTGCDDFRSCQHQRIPGE
jgi:hypothetical protein